MVDRTTNAIYLLLSCNLVIIKFEVIKIHVILDACHKVKLVHPIHSILINKIHAKHFVTSSIQPCTRVHLVVKEECIRHIFQEEKVLDVANKRENLRSI